MASIPANLLYREAMEQVHTYNSKLLLDRRLRMPYIDNQTGVAQQDCHLWVSRVQRCAPQQDGQIYSYPSRRWMVRKRPDFIGSSKSVVVKKEGEETTTQDGGEGEKVDVPAKPEETISLEPVPPPSVPLVTYEDYYDDDAAFDSDFDSDEEYGSRKKKRKSARGSKSKKSMALKFGGGKGSDVYSQGTEEKKKFYDCQICHKRYKNHQSLRYHYEHHNHNLPDNQQSTPATSTTSEPDPTSTAPPITTTSSLSTDTATETDDVEGGEAPPSDHVSGAKRQKGMPPSTYCDFCLGTTELNKKSGAPEPMVSCADCGRSGHPSCLQFNEKLTEQVKKYKWQCIECKSCCLCGTSDNDVSYNDEQLLFCDDCDRGYHMYCLNPPIAEPPEGSWQCQLCEARVKGEDISKVAVLPQQMDIGYVATTVKEEPPSIMDEPPSITSIKEEPPSIKDEPLEALTATTPSATAPIDNAAIAQRTPGVPSSPSPSPSPAPSQSPAPPSSNNNGNSSNGSYNDNSNFSTSNNTTTSNSSSSGNNNNADMINSNNFNTNSTNNTSNTNNFPSSNSGSSANSSSSSSNSNRSNQPPPSMNPYMHSAGYGGGHPGSGGGLMQGPPHPLEHASLPPYLRGPNHGPMQGYRHGVMNTHGGHGGVTHAPGSSHGYGPSSHGGMRGPMSMSPYGHPSFRPQGYSSSMGHPGNHGGGPPFLHARPQVPPNRQPGPLNGSPYGSMHNQSTPHAFNRAPYHGPLGSGMPLSSRGGPPPHLDRSGHVQSPMGSSSPAHSASPLPPQGSPASHHSLAQPPPESPLASPIMPMVGNDVGM